MICDGIYIGISVLKKYSLKLSYFWSQFKTISHWQYSHRSTKTASLILVWHYLGCPSANEHVRLFDYSPFKSYLSLYILYTMMGHIKDSYYRLFKSWKDEGNFRVMGRYSLEHFFSILQIRFVLLFDMISLYIGSVKLHKYIIHSNGVIKERDRHKTLLLS